MLARYLVPWNATKELSNVMLAPILAPSLNSPFPPCSWHAFKLRIAMWKQRSIEGSLHLGSKTKETTKLSEIVRQEQNVKVHGKTDGAALMWHQFPAKSWQSSPKKMLLV